MFKKGVRFDFWTFVGLLSLVFFGLFLVIPVIRMLIYSFQTGDSSALFSLDNFVKFFTRKYYTTALWNSIKVVLSATVLVILIGVPLAYITTTFKIRGNRLINILVIISMLSPPFLGAYSWILMLGRSGEITKLLESIGLTVPSIYGFGGILLVFVLKLFPYILSLIHI